MPHLKTFCLCALISLGLTKPIQAFADNCGAAGNLIQNCGFETGDFSNWTLAGNTTDASPAWTFVNNVAPHSGTYAAEMGPVGSFETLSQQFTDTPGAVGTLSFWLEDEVSLDPDGTQYTGFSQFTADIDGQVLTFLANPVDQAGVYTLFQSNFLMTGNDTLNFTLENDPSYFDLDDVSVVATAPEPSSVALLGTGLSAVCGLARRRTWRA